MSEMVERVARAILAAELLPFPASEVIEANWHQFAPDYAERYRVCARAAITAMREPTDAMYDALSDSGKMWREQTSTTIWRTMIDAALKEKETTDG